MSGTSLKQLYPQILPWERIRLLLAAQHRQDDTEYQRLFDGSTIRAWYFSEHLMAEQALHVLALTYITEQLDAIACVFFALTQLALHSEQEEGLENMAECSAYFFCTNAQGWKEFCDTIRIPAKELVSANHSGWILSFAEQYLPTVTLTPEAMMQRLSQPLVTASQLSRRWYERLKEMIASTPLDIPEVVPCP